MKICIVDHSAVSPHNIATTDLDAMVAALSCQLDELSLSWDVAPPENVRHDTIAGPDEYELGIWDTSDAPGAAGYHATDPTGRPYGKVFRDACDAILSGGTLAIATVVSHEGCELFMDRYADLLALRADGVTLDFLEMCDAVEEVTYDDPEGTGCAMSDYLLPSAFDPGASAPFDRQHALSSATDTTPGGYRTIATVTVNAQSKKAFVEVTAVYGKAHAFAQEGALAEARQRAKHHEASHATRHGVTEWLPL
jgi:hypothetical protein